MNIKEFPRAVLKENVDYAVKEITNVIKRYGPRESGNENCLAAQKHIKKEMDTFCDESGFESYKMAPKAFTHFTKTVAASIIIAVLTCLILALCGVFDNMNVHSFFIPQCVVGVVVGIGLFITVVEFLMYKQFTDTFYKKIEGHNFYATRKPRGEIKRRIVVSGHIDAAYEWRHILYGKGKYPLMGIGMGWAIGGGILSFLVAVVTVICGIVDINHDVAFCTWMLNYSYYFHLFTALGMVTLYLFVNFKRISPGANDNLTGTYSAVCALRMLDMAGIEFENTEVVAMITDGEEAGLRGCKQWAKDHKDEYNGDVETVVLCVDTLTDLEYLNVYSKDMSGTVKNDQKFSQLVMDAAHEAGYNDLKFANVFFGSSDAAAFSQAGIKATCLAAMDPKPADYYHNRRDNYDRLVPKAIETGFEIVLSTILKFDEQGGLK